MEKLKELRMTFIILLVGVFLLSGCLFTSKHEITFKTNGGSEVKNVTVKNGNKLETPEDPTKEGYVFDGWYLNGQEYNFDTEVEDDMTLVAKWRKVEVEEEKKDEEPTTTKKTTHKKKTVSTSKRKVSTTKRTKDKTKKTSTSKKTSVKLSEEIKTTKSTTTSSTTTTTTTKKPITTSTSTTTSTTTTTTTTTVPVVTTEPIEEKKELKMNIQVVEEKEENDDTGIIVSNIEPTNILETLISDKKPDEEEKIQYKVTIDTNSDNINTISKLSDEDLQELLNTEIKDWKVYNQTGVVYTLDIQDKVIKFTSQSEIKYLVIQVMDKAYIVKYDEEIHNWVIDYPSVKVIDEENAMYFMTLNDAVMGTSESNTIMVLKDMEVDEVINITKPCMIDGGNFKITALKDNLFNIKDVLSEDKDITIKNMNLQVKTFMHLENTHVKNIVLENLKGSYVESIIDKFEDIPVIMNEIELEKTL